MQKLINQLIWGKWHLQTSIARIFGKLYIGVDLAKGEDVCTEFHAKYHKGKLYISKITTLPRN
jgi:hypothetical protein